MRVNERAGQRASQADLVDVAKLVTSYYALHPDPAVPEQRVSFGTSGHRGSALRYPRRPSATTGPGQARPARCSSAGTPTRCPSPRS